MRHSDKRSLPTPASETPSLPTESSRFETFIERWSRDIVEDELNRRADWSPARSLTRMVGKVTHEYEGRFFIELIQNGHDAHPWGTIDGTLHITLDLTEGKYGC